jgi:type IV pilus assembly protein PilB
MNLLWERNLLDKEQREVVLLLQKNPRGRSTSQMLIDAGVNEEEVQRAVADLSGILFTKVEQENIDYELAEKIGFSFCQEHAIVPVCLDGERYVVSQSPDAVFLVEELCGAVMHGVRQAIGTSREIESVLACFGEEVHSSKSEDQGAQDQLDAAEEYTLDLESTVAEADSSPVVTFVTTMISTAVREGASDIHYEPSDTQSRVRYRIDGVLHDLLESPKRLHTAVVSRIKILSRLDISERRLPQDGRIRATILGRALDLRVSTVPTPKGEKVVLRLLDDRNIRVGLEDLGFRSEVLAAWDREIKSPNGIVLVTGPTGCGKTTTLYSSLQAMDRNKLNISTVEDPVEYDLDGITQIQIHDQIDMTFSRALRALLRQDPDVVLLGEIRDKETASVAIQAAMTGHLVLSTLHTNDAPSSLTRLINIGVEPFLVASAVNAVLAQRLARKVCKHCVTFKRPTDEERELFSDLLVEKIPHAVGCNKCRGSGYSGRLGVYELLLMNEELRDIIASNPTITTFQNHCIASGMQSLRTDGLTKVASGLTTLEELLRLT